MQAVAMNGDVDGAYELIMQLLDDADCKDQQLPLSYAGGMASTAVSCEVNAVVFGSVLKGYSRARRVERCQTV
eukprot:6298869-Amphidinium_carterae.1